MKKETSNQQTGEGNAPRMIAAVKVDTWLNELRATLVERSEFKLADRVVSARVVIKMLEAQRDELLAACKRVSDKPNNSWTWLPSVEAAIAKAEGKGEQCVICGKNSWECEHYEEANQE